jgi:hypothetical protein
MSKGGGTAASRSGVQLNDGADPSTRDVIHLPRARIQTPVTQIVAEVVDGELSWCSDPVQALYHGIPHSVGLTGHL